MDEIKSAEIDDIDRESLVKEIEQIRQAVGRKSSREKSDAESECDLEEYEEAGRESEESEDELAIIRSPRYGDVTNEEKKLEKQIPTHIISSDSEHEHEEAEYDENTQGTIVFPSRHTHPEFSQDISDNVCYQISEIVPRDNPDEVELLLTPVNQNAEPRDTQGILVPGSSTYQTSSTQFDPVYPEIHNSGYTLTELQPPAKQKSSFENKELDNDDVCWSPVYEMNHNYRNRTSETEQGNWFGAGSDEQENEAWISAEDKEDGVGEQSEVHHCLQMNRKYQAVIEEELSRIERLLLENTENQLGLTQMSQSSLTKAEAMAFKQRTTYSHPYFKDKTKEGPPDNQDTILRKDIGQPHPFKKASRPWSKEDNQVLTDAVKSAVLESKLIPLLQRIEMLSPRRSKTEAEETEIINLKTEIQQTKNLPLSTLVQNHALTIDWEDITDKVLPSRTPAQCEMYWYNEIHPLLNTEIWTKNEDKLLLNLAKENNEEDWNKIARELQTNRSAVQCLKRYQRSLNKGFLKSKWEKEEDTQLIKAVKICGVGAWEKGELNPKIKFVLFERTLKITDLLEGRTGAQCMHRYMKSINPDIKKGKWNKMEDDLLRKGIERFGSNWSKIRAMIPQRTDSQIRERWSDVLSPGINRGKWTTEEDTMLLKLVEEQGIGNWTKIASHMEGRNDNRCWRRWRFLKRNDPVFQSQCASLLRRRATMVVNFSKRPYDRPAIGPEDIDSNGMPILNPVDDNCDIPPRGSAATMASTCTTTTKSSTEQTTKLSSAKEPESRQARWNKRTQKPGGCLNVKRTKILKLGRSHPPGPPHQSKNKLTNIPSTSFHTQTNSQKKVVNTKTSNSSLPMTTRKKITMPSPTVVSQASALPNALPINYLTQFSVLLQAFSVDVSGALKNVRPQTTQVTSQLRPNSITTTSNYPGSGTTTVTQSCSQITDTSGNNNRTITGSPAGTASVIDNNRRRGDGQSGMNGDSCDIVVTQDIRNGRINDGASCNISGSIIPQEKQNRNILRGTNHCISDTRVTPEVTKACYNSICVPLEVEVTDAPGETNHPLGDTRVSRTAGDLRGQDETHRVTSGRFTCVSQKQQNDEQSTGVCRKEICAQNLKQVRNSDEEKMKCLNEHAVCVSRDSCIPVQHGSSSHDFVSNSNSSDEQGNIGKQNGRSKRKKTEISTENVNKRRRDVCNGNENKRSKFDTASSSEIKFVSDSENEEFVENPTGTPRRSRMNKAKTDVEGHVNVGPLTDSAAVSTTNVGNSLCERNRNDKTPRKQYPVRSTRGQRVSDPVAVESTTGNKNEQRVLKPTNTGGKKAKGKDKSLDKIHNKVVLTDHRERIIEKCIAGPSKSVSIVPPLPPSAITLNAFKKLLMSRKDLKTQADCLKTQTDCLKPASEKQPDTQSNDTQEERSSASREGCYVTRGQNPLASCLLVNSNSGESSVEQYRNSLPYQQLGNRFKSLFLWPGFLSIVNPNFSRKNDGKELCPRNKTRTNQGMSRKRT